MAKRFGHFNQVKSKKTKIDDGTDNLWNDSNFDNIDECLILATQQCEQGSSTLNYSNIFDRTNGNVYTSTQVVNGKEGIANNSGVRQEEKIKQLEAQIKTLTEKIECKDGEVSILRTRIKELKVHSEQEKNEKENLQKIAALNREILAIKSQLDFKNLEIVNLKRTAKCLPQQNHHHNLDTDNFTTIFERKGTRKLYTIFDARRPLGQNVSCDKIECHHLLNVNAVGNCNMQDGFLQSSSIRDITITLKHTLWLLHNCLEIRQHYMLSKNGQQNVIIQSGIWDARSSSGCIRDVERRASQFVGIVAEILPYAYCLRKTVLSLDVLGNINKILNLIKRTKMTDVVGGFLYAVAELLFKISQTDDFTTSQCPSSILDVFKQLLQTRPPVLTKQLLFLKQASAAAYPQYVNAFCKVFDTTSSFLLLGENILIEQENCLLQSLISLCQNRMIEDGCFDMSASEGILQLITILLNYNVSCLKSANNKDISHNCVCQLTVLGINVMHDLVNNYKRNKFTHIKHDERGRYATAFKYCIKILYIIGFKYFDTINKYFVDCQYKFIVNYLYLSRNVLGLNEFKDEALCDLNIHEDTCHINSANFDKIPVWH